MHNMMDGNMGGMMGMGMMIFMSVFWIAILALIIVTITFMVRKLQGKDDKAIINETPLDILKKRYAKGEIEREEFENKKKDLM